jgi:hypothetical protein
LRRRSIQTPVIPRVVGQGADPGRIVDSQGGEGAFHNPSAGHPHIHTPFPIPIGVAPVTGPVAPDGLQQRFRRNAQPVGVPAADQVPAGLGAAVEVQNRVVQVQQDGVEHGGLGCK